MTVADSDIGPLFRTPTAHTSSRTISATQSSRGDRRGDYAR